MSTDKHEFLPNEPFIRSLREGSRTLDASYPEAAESALIESVLQQTVDTPVGRRGTTPLLSFGGLSNGLSNGLRNGLRRSGLVRLVAASLVVHLGALTVFGMLAIREDSKHLNVRVRPPEASAFEEVEESFVLELPDDLDLDSDREQERFANRLRLDRFLLARDAHLLTPAENPSVAALTGSVSGSVNGTQDRIHFGADSEIANALAIRVESLRSRSWSIPKSDDRILKRQDLVATATLLDAYVFTGTVGELPKRLDRLRDVPAELLPIAARLRARARSYGILDGEALGAQHPLIDLFEDLPR